MNDEYDLYEIEEKSDRSYVGKLDVVPQYYKFIIGRGGATLKELRVSTKCSIDIPRRNSDSSIILVSGSSPHFTFLFEESHIRTDAIACGIRV